MFAHVHLCVCTYARMHTDKRVCTYENVKRERRLAGSGVCGLACSTVARFGRAIDTTFAASALSCVTGTAAGGGGGSVRGVGGLGL